MPKVKRTGDFLGPSDLVVTSRLASNRRSFSATRVSRAALAHRLYVAVYFEKKYLYIFQNKVCNIILCVYICIYIYIIYYIHVKIMIA